jgi:hypothetical protein
MVVFSFGSSPDFGFNQIGATCVMNGQRPAADLIGDRLCLRWETTCRPSAMRALVAPMFGKQPLAPITMN